MPYADIQPGRLYTTRRVGSHWYVGDDRYTVAGKLPPCTLLLAVGSDAWDGHFLWNGQLIWVSRNFVEEVTS